MSSFLESVPISLWLLLTLAICLTDATDAVEERRDPCYMYKVPVDYDCDPYLYPTPKPTPRPTPRPTHYPTKKPTLTPTSSPSPQPTTASPTQPGFISCGEDSVGMYSSGKLIFEISMPFDGELIFDASGSKVALTTIEAFT
eukprot:673520_1